MPLDEAYLDNGCMWYVPGSHLKPMRKHASTAKNGALMCEGNENEAVSIPLKPGSCVLHHGATVHYSRGNTTHHQRRAMIVNFRPQQMIDFERQQGFDHTGENKVRNTGPDLP
jgi:ectoine hydroxylase-related dioxygenase (phytanoyl-CoA dioxygenase family)